MSVYEEIRAKFPDPKSGIYAHNLYEDYCVGGALCLYQADRARFPAPVHLGHVLCRANHRLPQDVAIGMAHRLTRLNDLKRFEYAWATLKEALEYGQEAAP